MDFEFDRMLENLKIAAGRGQEWINQRIYDTFKVQEPNWDPDPRNGGGITGYNYTPPDNYQPPRNDQYPT